MTVPDQETEIEPTEHPTPKRGSTRLGPFEISGKTSVILIYLIILGFNVLLIAAVVLAALHRAGRL
jgi:hypothetical protein